MIKFWFRLGFYFFLADLSIRTYIKGLYEGEYTEEINLIARYADKGLSFSCIIVDSEGQTGTFRCHIIHTFEDIEKVTVSVSQDELVPEIAMTVECKIIKGSLSRKSQS